MAVHIHLASSNGPAFTDQISTNSGFGEHQESNAYAVIFDRLSVEGMPESKGASVVVLRF
jgi:hypothetical protein